MNNEHTSSSDCEIVNPICAGIDVHRDSVHVTLSKTNDNKTSYEYRKFRTVKKDLIELREWLLENDCHIVGMESTGKYWLPVLNAFEGYITVNLYNARHIKNIPGRKTDRADSKWIAMITRNAMIKPSFIPIAKTRDSRCLARTRKSLVEQRTRIRQMIHGILDTCSIRIATFVSDIYGVSGRNLINLLLESKPITKAIIEKNVIGQIKKKVEEIYDAMNGYIRPAHLKTLKMLLSQDRILTDEIQKIETELKTFVLDTPEKIDVFNR
ncbi:MAG: transposase, partial [Candidatus Subteraquimicrobiales bacterium]|nr:transposase [Candidatus Subteraquimicrobiales bacterium]